MATLNTHETFGMQSGERYFWASYQLFVVLSSLIGDTLILLATTKKDSFKLNKFLVTVIQHIAVCDLIISVTHILPGTVSLVADSWVLGYALCIAKPYFAYYFYPANMSLICALTTGKFLLLRKPLRATKLSKKRAHLVCSIIWATWMVYPALFLALGRDDVEFDYTTYNCEYSWTANAWKKIQPVTFLMSAFVPNAVIITTTVPTLKYLVAARKSARRTKGSVPWQGALTVVLTATIYCISTLPLTVYLIAASFIKQVPGEKDPFHFHLQRYGMFLGMINITSNFFVYTLTITSFRRYLLSKMPDISSLLTSGNSTGNSVIAN